MEEFIEGCLNFRQFYVVSRNLKFGLKNAESLLC